MSYILLICESLSDAEELVRIKNKIQYRLNDIDIISMHPEIKYTLECHNIASISTTEYIHHDDYKIIDSDCEKIYLELQESTRKHFSKCYSQCVMNMFLYYTFFAFYTIVWNYHLLMKLLSRKQYDTVLTFSPVMETNKSPWFLAEQNIIHIMLSQLCGNKPFKHDVIYRVEPKKINYPYNNILKSFRQLIRPVYLSALKIISSRTRKYFIVMIPSTGKNMHILCNDLAKKYKNIIYFSLGGGNSILSELYNLLILIKFLITGKGSYDQNIKNGQLIKLSLSLLTTFEMEEKSGIASDSYKKILAGVNASEMKLKILGFKEIIEFLQTNKILQIISYLEYERARSLGLEKFLELCKSIKIIISQMSLGLTCELSYLAEKYSIPSMLISHGSHVLHDDSIAKYEHELICNNMLLGGYRFYGIQTALSYEFVNAKQISKNSLVIIKPTILTSNISKSTALGKKLTVLHAGTIKGIGNRHIYETPNEMLETFQETIEILSECKNIQLTIKFRETNQFSFKALNKLLGILPHNVSLSSGGQIGDFIASSHLLMSFSSTTIEEALISDTPVLLYGGKGRYSHIPTLPLKIIKIENIMKPVTFIDNRKILKKYFNILNNNYEYFIKHKINFDKYKTNDSLSAVEWIEKSNIIS